jgi:hypothetical protein
MWHRVEVVLTDVSDYSQVQGLHKGENAAHNVTETEKGRKFRGSREWRRKVSYAVWEEQAWSLFFVRCTEVL